MEYRIDCEKIDSPGEFHRTLAQELSLPEWYGKNLDALYDCLTAIGTETRLTLVNWNPTVPYARGFRRVLAQAEQDNPHFHVTFS